jgi:hypothetical protein
MPAITLLAIEDKLHVHGADVEPFGESAIVVILSGYSPCYFALTRLKFGSFCEKK